MRLYVPNTPATLTVPVVPPSSAVDLARFEFAEAIFVDGREEQVPVFAKWIYALDQRQIVAIIHAGETWQVEHRQFGRTDTRDDAVLELVAGPRYAFFVSPFELPAPIQESLAGDRSDLEWYWLFQVDSIPGLNRSVVLRDPFERSLGVHQQCYLPALELWLAYLFGDPNRISERFIASTLKCCIGNNDPLNLRKCLRDGEPEAWLAGFDAEELARRTTAERAMAEVANAVDNRAYRLIAAAAMENGGDDFEAAFLHLSCVTHRMGDTLPGRQLMLRLIAQRDVLPLHAVLNESVDANGLDFREHRYLANAGMAMLAELMPGLLALARARATPRHLLAEDLVAAWISCLMVQGKATKSEVRLHKKLVLGTEINRLGSYHEKMVRRLEVDGKTHLSDVIERTLPAGLVRAERFAAALDVALKPVTNVAAASLEVINFASAYSSFRRSETTPLSVASMIGASADFSAMAIGLVKQLRRESSVWLSRAGTGAGLVAAICDACDFASAAASASERHDYQQMAGQGVAAIGASGIAFSLGVKMGADLGLWAAGGTAVSGPVGLAIGASLIASGVVWAKVFARTPYQHFASHSFLGEYADKFPDDDDKPYPWALGRLIPAEKRPHEHTALLGLLSSFAIEPSPIGNLRLVPGKLCQAGWFEVLAQRQYTRHDPVLDRAGPLLCKLVVDLDANSIMLVTCNRPIAVDRSAIHRAADRSVEAIVIDLHEVLRLPGGHYVDAATTFWVRYVGDGRCRMPYVGTELGTKVPAVAIKPAWLRVCNEQTAVDDDRGTSFDAVLVADLSVHPPPNFLGPFEVEVVSDA